MPQFLACSRDELVDPKPINCNAVLPALTPNVIGVGCRHFPDANEQRTLPMPQRLHLVFGGELLDPSRNIFKDVNDIDLVGMLPGCQSACEAWKSEAHRTVDNAQTHRLRGESAEVSSTEELG